MKRVMEGWTVTIALLLGAILADHIRAQAADATRRARLYETLIVAASIKHRVDPRLLWTVAWLESGFRPRVISSAGAQGMMQFMPATGRRYGLRDPFDPAQAFDAAARYLRDLQEMFGRRLDLILAGYNAGESAVRAFRAGRKLILSDGRVINPRGIKSAIPPYRETVNYVMNGAHVFGTLARAGYFSERRLARLRNIESPKEEKLEALVTVDLEETPEDIVDLKKGSVYVVEETPSLPAKKSAKRSIYAQ
ncbi:MAG TPA: lytic transglycosylase domain-containing protein [Blastocatellia bacterium]